MIDIVTRWAQTAELFSRRLAEVEQNTWEAPSTCSEWTVQQLVEHAVATQARFGRLLGVEEAELQWAVVRLRMTERLHELKDLKSAVEVPGLGMLTADQILEICTNDLLIHTWDLAHSVGLDEELPDQLVEPCLRWLRSMPEEVLRAGRFAQAQHVSDDVPVQERMLAFAGRRIHRSPAPIVDA